jgi:hypothetical protein
MITVFDYNLSAMIQFLVPEISCGYDPLIKECSPLYLHESVVCIENAVWNIVDKKCFCSGGYFLDTNSRTCEKCKCRDAENFCRNSATDCYEDSYMDINLKLSNDVVDLACWMTKEF